MVFSKDPLTKKNGRIVLLTKKIRDSGLPKVLMSKSRNLLDRTEEWKLFQLWPLIWEWHWIVDIYYHYHNYCGDGWWCWWWVGDVPPNQNISYQFCVLPPPIYTPSPPPHPVTGRPHKIVVKLLKEETILRFQDWGKGNGLTFPDLYLTHNVAPRSPVLPVVAIHYQFHHGITHRRHWADGPFSLSSSSDTALGEVLVCSAKLSIVKIHPFTLKSH